MTNTETAHPSTPPTGPCLLSNTHDVSHCRFRRAIRLLAVGSLVFTFGFLMMWYFASKPNYGIVGVSGNDSFYHLKMSSMLTGHGLVDTFPWLRFSYFRDEGDGFVSHHYGFHVLLLPFVKVSEWLTGEPLAGGRWAVCTFFGLNVLLFYGILRTARVPLAWLWLLVLLLLPFQFFMRHGYVRAIGPSLIFMQLIILLVLQRRAVWLGVVAALFNHLYLGAVMFTPVLIAAFAAACVIDRDGWQKFPWKIVLISAAGWLIGLVTYPYFGGMLEFLKVQVLGSGLSPDIEVGREWKPYEGVWWFALHAGAILIVFTVTALVRFRLGPWMNADEMFLMLLNVGFLILTMKARRFIEYWPMFALISAALLSRPVVLRWLIDQETVKDEDGWLGSRVFARWVLILASVATISAGVRVMYRGLDKEAPSDLWPLAAAGVVITAIGFVFGETIRDRRWDWSVAGVRALVTLGVVSIVASVGFIGWRQVRNDTQLRFDLPEVRKLMAFMKAESPPGAVVFTTDWDDFPLFFYHNSHNYFIVGLDPKFTHARRPDLWDRYVKLSRGQAPARIQVRKKDDRGVEYEERADVKLADIREHFESDYVITDRDHKSLARQLAHDTKLAELVYPGTDFKKDGDAPYLVFRIKKPSDG